MLWQRCPLSNQFDLLSKLWACCHATWSADIKSTKSAQNSTFGALTHCLFELLSRLNYDHLDSLKKVVFRRNKFLKQRGNAGPNIRRCISILFVLVVVLTELGSSEFSEKVKGEILKTFPSSLQTNDVATLAPEKGVRFIIEPLSVSLGATWLAVTTPWPKRKTVTKLNNRWVHCPFVATCDSSCLESYRVEWAGWNCFEIIPNLRSEVVNRLAWLSGMCRLCSMFLTGWANTCQLCDGRLNFFVILTWMLVEADYSLTGRPTLVSRHDNPTAVWPFLSCRWTWLSFLSTIGGR